MTEHTYEHPAPESQPREVSPKMRHDNAQAEIDRMLDEAVVINALDEERRDEVVEQLSKAQAALALLDKDSPQASDLRQEVNVVLQELDAQDERMKAWKNATDAALLSMARIIEENMD